MNLEEKKKLYKVVLCILAIGAIAFSLRCMFGESDRSNTDTDRAVKRVESGIVGATDRIESAASRARDARDAVERANGELTRSEKSVGEIQDGLNRCQERVRRCQALNESALRIVGDIERSSGK